MKYDDKAPCSLCQLREILATEPKDQDAVLAHVTAAKSEISRVIAALESALGLVEDEDE
jgi:hypothetical protein